MHIGTKRFYVWLRRDIRDQTRRIKSLFALCLLIGVLSGTLWFFSEIRTTSVTVGKYPIVVIELSDGHLLIDRLRLTTPPQSVDFHYYWYCENRDSDVNTAVSESEGFGIGEKSDGIFLHHYAIVPIWLIFAVDIACGVGLIAFSLLRRGSGRTGGFPMPRGTT